MPKVSFRKRRKCGWCSYIPMVATGGAIVKNHAKGPAERMYGEEALNWIEKMCRCQGVEPESDQIVSEIRREGSRILKPGVPVSVQPKRRLGTKKEAGEVVECYADGTVKIALVDIKGEPKIRVPADEFVKVVNRS